LSGLSAGKHELPVKVEAPQGTRVVKTVPSRVSVTLVQISEKIVPVHVTITAQPPEGFLLSGTLPSPAQAIVRGAYQDITRVKSVEARLDLSKQKGSQRLPAQMTAVDSRLQEVSGVTVSPKDGEVYVVVEADQIDKQIPVDIQVTGTPAAGVQLGTVSIDPQVVTVVGSRTLVESLQTATGDPVDISGLDKTTVKQVTLIPENGVIYYPGTVTVQVELKAQAEGNTP
jgi:YbbR domain-containing protein